MYFCLFKDHSWCVAFWVISKFMYKTSPHSWTILEGENPRISQKIRYPVFQCSRVHDVGRTLVVFPNKSEAFKLTMNAGYGRKLVNYSKRIVQQCTASRFQKGSKCSWNPGWREILRLGLKINPRIFSLQNNSLIQAPVCSGMHTVYQFSQSYFHCFKSVLRSRSCIILVEPES
jgi:hypothetical protein